MEEKFFSYDLRFWFLWPRVVTELYLVRQPEDFAKTFFVRETYWLCFRWWLRKELIERDEVWE